MLNTKMFNHHINMKKLTVKMVSQLNLPLEQIVQQSIFPTIHLIFDPSEKIKKVMQSYQAPLQRILCFISIPSLPFASQSCKISV